MWLKIATFAKDIYLCVMSIFNLYVWKHLLLKANFVMCDRPRRECHLSVLTHSFILVLFVHIDPGIVLCLSIIDTN